MTKLSIKLKKLKFEEVTSWTLNGKPMSTVVKFSSAKIDRTREILPEVFADFDRHGDIVAMEFMRPGEFEVDATKAVFEKLGLAFPNALAAMVKQIEPTEALCSS